MSKAGQKGMRNVKKVVEKITHEPKLRTNIQAQMAVGELFKFFIMNFFHDIFFP